MRHQPRPRVAIVAPSLGILGGQSVQAALLAEHLRADGYRVDWVPVDPPFPAGAGWVRRVRGLRTLMNEGLYLPSLARLRHVDVVHVFSASYWSFLLAPLPAIAAARSFKKPVLLNYHSGEAADHLAHWGSFVHPWLRAVDEIVVPSVYLRKVFERHGYRPQVIHNVVETVRFRYRPRVPLTPSFLSVRNLESHYGIEETLIAFALLQTTVPHATLTLAGQGPQAGELRHLSEALGLRRVEFIGPVDPASMPALYDRHSMFLNSSFIDNQPLSLLEAMASGLPIVTTGVGDIPNMLSDGETGSLVPVGDPAAMAKAAGRLLERPEQALLMAQRAHDTLDRFDWASIGPAWAALYERLAAAEAGSLAA